MRIVMLLPKMQEEEKCYQFRKKLCSGMRNKISELEFTTVKEMMVKVQHIASRMDEHLTMPRAGNLAAMGAFTPARPYNTSNEGQCWNCNEFGHQAKKCPKGRPARFYTAQEQSRGRGGRNSRSRGRGPRGRAGLYAMDAVDSSETGFDTTGYDDYREAPAPESAGNFQA